MVMERLSRVTWMEEAGRPVATISGVMGAMLKRPAFLSSSTF
jgi:hypothetical protein